MARSRIYFTHGPVALLLLLTAPILAVASTDSGLLSLLPTDAQTVASINVDSSRSSSFGQFMLRQMSANDHSFQDMVEQTGFDPRRDLQTFVFAGFPSDGKKNSRFLVLARGLFDQRLITANALAKGMSLTSAGGVPLLVSKEGSQTALAFPETGISVFGDRSKVERVLLNRSNPTVLASDLQTQITAASAGNDAWFASTLPANDLVGRVPQGAGPVSSEQSSQVMQAVLQSGGGIRFGSTIQLSFNALTRSDKDALSLTDLIRFLSSAIQMQRQNDSRAALLAPAMDSMTLRADGRKVYTSVSIPEADLEQIVSTQAKPSRRAR